MPLRPRPGRFIDAGRVILIVGAGRAKNVAKSMQGGPLSISQECPALVARVTRSTLDAIGRGVRTTGVNLRHAAHRLDRRRSG